jgi:hypothetical protein
MCPRRLLSLTSCRRPPLRPGLGAPTSFRLLRVLPAHGAAAGLGDGRHARLACAGGAVAALTRCGTIVVATGPRASARPRGTAHLRRHGGTILSTSTTHAPRPPRLSRPPSRVSTHREGCSIGDGGEPLLRLYILGPPDSSGPLPRRPVRNDPRAGHPAGTIAKRRCGCVGVERSAEARSSPSPHPLGRPETAPWPLGIVGRSRVVRGTPPTASPRRASRASSGARGSR